MKQYRVLPFTLLAALFACGSALAQMELKFGHVGNPGSLFDKSANEFAKRANAKLGGKAKVVVFGSSQLGEQQASVAPDHRARQEVLESIKNTVNISFFSPRAGRE